MLFLDLRKQPSQDEWSCGYKNKNQPLRISHVHSLRFDEPTIAPSFPEVNTYLSNIIALLCPKGWPAHAPRAHLHNQRLRCEARPHPPLMRPHAGVGSLDTPVSPRAHLPRKFCGPKQPQPYLPETKSREVQPGCGAKAPVV